MHVEFKRLKEIERREIIELLNHPLVRRHMPLSKGNFDNEDYETFIAAKEKLWIEHGYGPWAFVVDDKFVGWGGLQYEEGDADLAVVIHPDYWGTGKMIYEKIIEKAFAEMDLESITALLPPSRTRTKGMIKLGFKLDGELILDGERFIRYRLYLSKNRAKNGQKEATSQ